MGGGGGERGSERGGCGARNRATTVRAGGGGERGGERGRGGVVEREGVREGGVGW